MYRIANVTTLDGKTKKPERIGRRVYAVKAVDDDFVVSDNFLILECKH